MYNPLSTVVQLREPLLRALDAVNSERVMGIVQSLPQWLSAVMAAGLCFICILMTNINVNINLQVIRST